MSIRPLNPVLVATDPGDIAEVRHDDVNNHRALYATRSFSVNDVIASFGAKASHDTPNYLTVQVGEGIHIELFPEYLECANHSCNPNCFFDTTRFEFIALRDIAVGEELTFFYPSAEWDMDRSFQCLCGSPHCFGHIQGARYLPEEAFQRYRFTDYITRKKGQTEP
jgi:hypothetical protein